MSQAEDVRLMYVAATRARDHLVLSLRRSANRWGESSLAAAMSRHLGTRRTSGSPSSCRRRRSRRSQNGGLRVPILRLWPQSTPSRPGSAGSMNARS